MREIAPNLHVHTRRPCITPSVLSALVARAGAAAGPEELQVGTMAVAAAGAAQLSAAATDAPPPPPIGEDDAERAASLPAAQLGKALLVGNVRGQLTTVRAGAPGADESKVDSR